MANAWLWILKDSAFFPLWFRNHSGILFGNGQLFILIVEKEEKDQFCTLTIISMHNTSNERFFLFITTVVKQKYKVGNPDKKRKLSGMISELFREKSGIF